MFCINPIVLYSNSKKREGEKKRSSEFAVVPEEEGKEEESAIAAKNTKLNSYILFHSRVGYFKNRNPRLRPTSHF